MEPLIDDTEELDVATPALSYSKSDELALWEKGYKQGDKQSKKALLKKLDPLIRKFTSKFRSNIPQEVLHAKAYVIVDKALPGYDPSKAQLNTYLTHQLQPLHRTVAENADINYIPEQRQLKISAYNTGLNTLRDKYDREPTTTEMAKHLGWNQAEVGRMRREMRGKLLEDNAIATSFDERNTDQDAIQFVYDELEPKHQLVMEHVMGLNGNEPKKLEAVAKLTKMSVDQVRYAKNHIKAKLDRFYGDFKPPEVTEFKAMDMETPEVPELPEPPKLAMVDVAAIMRRMFSGGK